MTLYATRLGVGELNPIMKWLLEIGPFTFFLTKFFLVILSALLINRFGGDKSRRVFKYVCLIFWALTTWHMYGVFTLYGDG